MQYSGGKESIAGKIAKLLQPEIYLRGGSYSEPFLGGASVFSRVVAEVKHGSDANPWLMCMWQAVYDGWVPPSEISEVEYADIKSRKPMEPLTAFAGFGCSFGGKWFGGYARSSAGRNYAGITQRSISKKLAGFGEVKLLTSDFSESPNAGVIYCDPPYANTTNGYSTGKFDSVAFWEWVRRKEYLGCAVFVSEYSAPTDFTPVATFQKKVTMDKRNGYKTASEHVFRITN